MGSDPLQLGFKGCDQCPVERVSWDDVQEFIKKLNAKTGKTYRLPTEAEWEYAARGGGKQTYAYAGSNTVNEVAWYSSNAGSKTHPVGEKKANELGLYDMSGNVREWCQDWYADDYYAKSPSSNPQGLSTGSNRVLRGGSWFDNPAYVRVADRTYYTPDFRYDNIGFRLARQQ
jgi:formylglycine-generating enzyme required for sulfatase activity